jgi:hypothetical protein
LLCKFIHCRTWIFSKKVGNRVGNFFDEKKGLTIFHRKSLILLGVPKRIRTAVDGVKGFAQSRSIIENQAVAYAYLYKNYITIHGAVHRVSTQKSATSQEVRHAA